ncbi:MAG: class II fumarate hydratase [Miniphocaeibacter sp.]|uniref:class II fumarate hydratase n=1 Tax=Miniphocaeibacter sp. TaxID=3100973 RepID=UPI0018043988|nr:class II fumarate hydratase [Gallicola sp.]
MDYRIEKDSMGELEVPSNKYWGAQTQRSYNNFEIGIEKMPVEIIDSFAILKKACAITNNRLGILSEEKKDFIAKVSDEILEGKLDDNFPLVVWQTGSGTQSNMNINEVIANRGNELAEKKLLHPNDDVNKSQSSNDTFPTAMHIAGTVAIENYLIPELEKTLDVLYGLSIENRDVIKIGRTHLQDATPLTLGQEISGWSAMIEKSIDNIKKSVLGMHELALGGTAVGTGINCPEGFDVIVAEEISNLTGIDFKTAENKFHSLTSKDEIVFCHGALKALAADLLKIANDVRWLASGPRSGLGEISIPENEPGSSIMPGKVNPTQAEALTMVVAQVLGNDVTIGFGASQGNFELNVYMPVIIYNFLQSVRLLADGIKSFREKCLVGIKANKEKIQYNLDNSLMLVTALNTHIGYDKAAQIARHAHLNNLTLKESALELEYLTEDEFDKWVKPENMI